MRQFIITAGIFSILTALFPLDAKAADSKYVPIPTYIQRMFNFQNLRNSNGVSAANLKTLGIPEGISVKINAMQCTTSTKGAAGAKSILLSSNEIRNDLIQTKNCGAIKLIMNSSNIIGLELQEQYLPGLVEFFKD